MLHVTAAILRNGAGELLICRRGPGGSCGGLWEFPGGKVEPGESEEACVARECREELAVDIALDGVYDRFTYAYPEREIAFTFFTGRIPAGSPVCTVHEAIAWVRRADLGPYPFCPADEGLVRRLMGE